MENSKEEEETEQQQNSIYPMLPVVVSFPPSNVIFDIPEVSAF